jgi:translation elongation factor EF-G
MSDACLQGVLDGVIDVVEMKAIRWTDPSGRAMQVSDLTPEGNPGYYTKALQAREALLEQLADIDDSVMRAVLEVHLLLLLFLKGR